MISVKGESEIDLVQVEKLFDELAMRRWKVVSFKQVAEIDLRSKDETPSPENVLNYIKDRRASFFEWQRLTSRAGAWRGRYELGPLMEKYMRAGTDKTNAANWAQEEILAKYKDWKFGATPLINAHTWILSS